jgi:hypothetical protein
MHAHHSGTGERNLASATPRRLEPQALGPLEGLNLPEGGAGELFAGDEALLGARQRNKFVELWRTAAPVVNRLLQPQERILYACRGVEKPAALIAISMGAISYNYHHRLLVLTETRLLEIETDAQGKKILTRIRSFPMGQTRNMKMGFFSLALVTADGKKHQWSVSGGGNRRVLKALLARVGERLRPDHLAAQKAPLWHCSQCLAVCVPAPKRCDACGTDFRTPRAAALLALAFPGAGFLYAGHPFLALCDFLGETATLVGGAFVLATTSGGDGAAVAAFLAFLFVVEKLESIHVSHFLVARAKPVNAQARARWNRFATVGGVLSLLALSGAALSAGRLAGALDQDLDFAAQRWHGNRGGQQILGYAGDPTLRSQWMHDEGWVATVFGYQLNYGQGLDDFRGQFLKEVESSGMEAIREDDSLPAGLNGFRYVGLAVDDEGTEVVSINYFIFDRENQDIHQVMAVVPSEQAGEAENKLSELLTQAHWIPAQELARGGAPASERPAEALTGQPANR